MTVPLSPHKVSRILRSYFRGLPQKKIAHNAGVDQSTVSLYSSRFKEVATELGLLVAGEEYSVFKEVDELRSLSVELLKIGLTAEDAREGAKIIQAFNKLGIKSYMHLDLVRACKNISDEDFVLSVVRFGEIEDNLDKSYDEIMSDFESIASQLPLSEQKLMALRAEIESLNNTVATKKSELDGIQSQLVQFREKARAEKSRLNAELEAEMKRHGVKEQEVKEVIKLKTEMVKKGLNISTFIQTAEEFKL